MYRDSDLANATAVYISEQTEPSLRKVIELGKLLMPLIESGAPIAEVIALCVKIDLATLESNQQIEQLTSDIVAGSVPVLLEIISRIK